MSMDREVDNIIKWQQIAEEMKELDVMEDESPEEATEDEKMKKGSKKASEKDVIQFLKDNPNPDDDDVHDWATENEFEIHGLEKIFYKLATYYVESDKK